jgi:hypothetical protein
MIVRIEWAKPNENGGRMYTVYEAHEYFVERRLQETPEVIRIMLDVTKHDLCLSAGDAAYIMNNDGKTIDVIKT